MNNNVDLLFLIDDSTSMTSMQQKLAAELPAFVAALESGPVGQLSLHIGVVSSDLGAPGDATASVGCTARGDDGVLQSSPRGACTDSTLVFGDTFVSDADMIPNFTAPSISDVLQCIVPLGEAGCGFEHQLAAIDRALGADGQGAAPAQNANFLRPDAYLAIVILTNEDDCSAPADTTLYSLNGAPQSLANPLGPIADYRCNRYGHLCQDPTSSDPTASDPTAPDPTLAVMPPLNPPDDAAGTPPSLALTDCVSDDTGLLTPVSKLVSDIKALKEDPDAQIFVAAIAAPPTPYAVEWVPAAGSPQAAPGELWPQVMHSCGAAGGDDVNPAATAIVSDGSYGDPPVRIAQFVNAFPNSVLASICDADYGASLTAIGTKLSQLFSPLCITGKIQSDVDGNPLCSVVVATTTQAIPSCGASSATPCWRLEPGVAGCAGQSVIVDRGADGGAGNLPAIVRCSLCLPGTTASGC